MAHSKPIKDILTKSGLAPHKKLGQNFLVHQQTAEQIVALANLSPGDIVVELGVGLGALTMPLSKVAHQIIGIELDGGIVRWHQEHNILPENVSLIHQDLLKADFHDLANKCGGRLKILANLPYSISNPLLFKLIDNAPAMEWAILMLQKEVGQRLTAGVGTKEYGVLSVLLAACASVKTLMELGPGQFHPRPKVDSVVVKITFSPTPDRVTALPSYDKSLFTRIVKSAFQKRRKTLSNALSSSGLLDFDKVQINSALKEASIQPSRRAETLSLEEYIQLTNVLRHNT